MISLSRLWPSTSNTMHTSACGVVEKKWGEMVVERSGGSELGEVKTVVVIRWQ